jgi:DNA polymerase III epsilon subunit-like protein
MALYLDTETTGLHAGGGDTIVEIAIVDEKGIALINTLVNPKRSIPWYASKVHGIKDYMVTGKPTLEDLLPNIRKVISGQQLVIYNASFDISFFPNRLRDAASIDCAMRGFANKVSGGVRKLDVAAAHVGHVWTGEAHRALADTLACRSVWRWLEKKKN